VTFAIAAVRGLQAAWRIVCLDKRAVDDFDQGMEAFWDSFKAFFLVAPLYLYSSVMGARLSVPPGDPPSLFASLVLLALLWVAWPYVMLGVSRLIGVERNYVRYIITYNWTTVYVIAAIAPVLMLQQIGIFSAQVAALFSLVVVVWSLYMRWFVARHALKVEPALAIALVAGDLVLSIAGSLLVQA
jgi:hypothetical protein